jgi:tRNA nucleotidyltransferase (CCA-adding enzyme)
MKKHMGPQIWFKEHQERFLEKYSGKAWVEGDRWIVEVPRTYESVEAFFQGVLLPGEINYLRFGKHIKAEILREHGIVDVNDFLKSQCDDEVLRFLHLYLNKNELLCR